MKYSEQVYKNYADESHIGSFEVEDITIGTGLVGAPACGDVMKLQIKVKKELNKEIIEDAKVMVFGCGSAIASSTFSAKMLIGKTLDEAKLIKNSDIAQALDLPAIKTHCSVLAAEAIEEAIEDYQKKQSENVNEEDFSLDISDAAQEYILNILKKQSKDHEGNAIRIVLEQSSCGLSYKIKQVKGFSDTIQGDTLFKTKSGLCIFFDKKIKNIINGTKMELREDQLKSGIVFVNPNEVGKCGCGIKFKLKDTKTDESTCGT